MDLPKREDEQQMERFSPVIGGDAHVQITLLPPLATIKGSKSPSIEASTEITNIMEVLSITQCMSFMPRT